MNAVPAAPVAPTAPRRSRRRLALAVTLATVTALTGLSVAAQAAVPTPPSGWNLMWSDDFTGASGTLPSSANWIVDTGTSYPGGPANWGTGEIQTYTGSTANLAQDGAGNLRITPLRDSAGRWTSARIETVRTDFKPPSGGVLAIEGRIQMPNVTAAQAAGYWPAFWALGAPYRGNYQNWPGIGEIDVMENVNGLNQVWGALHCGVAPGGPCNEFSGLGATRVCPGSACQAAFHTYRTEWDTSVSPQQLRWYVDGQLFHTVTETQVGATYWAQMTGHGGYFLLLNVAMGGSFPDGVAGYVTPTGSTVSGRPMLVDYVAVYRRGGGSNPTPTPTTPAPTTPPPSGTVDAYGTIQAEAFSGQNGVAVETCAEGGQNIAALRNGDWARYDNVDFGTGGPRDFLARVASGAASGVSGLVEVRLDSPTGTPIGSFALANTGGWQSWRSVPGNVSAVTGRHSVYLTFSSGQSADFVNVNWFTFRR